MSTNSTENQWFVIGLLTLYFGIATTNPDSGFFLKHLLINTFFFGLICTFVWKRQYRSFFRVYHLDCERENTPRKSSVAGVEVGASDFRSDRSNFIDSLSSKSFETILFRALFIFLYGVSLHAVDGHNGVTKNVPVILLIYFMCGVRSWGGVLLSTFVGVLCFLLVQDQGGGLFYLSTITLVGLLLLNIHVLNSWYHQKISHSYSVISLKASLKAVYIPILLWCMMFFIFDAFIRPEKSAFDYLTQSLKTVTSNKREDLGPLSNLNSTVSTPTLSNIGDDSFDHKSLEEMFKQHESLMDLDLLSDLDLSELTNRQISKSYKNLEQTKSEILSRSKGGASAQEIGELLSKYQMSSDELAQLLKGRIDSKGVKSVHQDNESLLQKLESAAEKARSQKDYLKDVEELNHLIDLANKVPASEQKNQTIEDIEALALELSENDEASVTDMSSLAKLKEEVEKTKEDIEAQKENEEKDKLTEKWIGAFKVFGILFMLYLIYRTLFSKKVLIEEEIPEELKLEILDDLKKRPRRFTSFEEEVRENYKFFHEMMKKLYFQYEAPPAFALYKELEVSSRYKQHAAVLGKLFNELEFALKRNFSTRDKNQFRKFYLDFEKRLRESIKS